MHLSTQSKAFYQPWSHRKQSFQHWLFNITIGIMSVLIIGFMLSAITTRSGIKLALTSENLVDRAKLLSAPANRTTSTLSDSEPAADRVVVEVLNGIGIPGLAGEFTDFLRDRGYDIVRFTNAQRFDYPRTLVINRGTDYQHAVNVATALGLELNAVENMPKPDLHIDVTVVLGQDYHTLSSYRAMQATAP